jgi:ribosomal-protein-alanine N-acetyltransferase
MIFPILETEQLVLRELTVAEAEHVFGFFSLPEVMQFYHLAGTPSISCAYR